jgi:hypothetical protein
MDNSTKSPLLPATDSAPRPGDFPVGSASSRAAARMLLKRKEQAEELKTNRPPDVRMVFDLPHSRVEVESVSSERVRTNRVDRYISGGEVVEIVFPAHAYKGECLGVCSVPPDVSVEEALRELRKQRDVQSPTQLMPYPLR